MSHYLVDVQPTRVLAVRGAFWAAVGALLRYLISGVTALILVRLLSPGDFGILAVTYVAQELIAHIASVGFHDAIIQRPHLDELELDTAFVGIVLVAGGFVLVAILLTPLITRWFGEPVLAPVWIVVVAASFLRAVSMVPHALLARKMEFRWIVAARVGSIALGCVCAVAAALLGAGVWSLVIQVVVVNLVGLVLVWRVVSWWPRWRVSVSVLRRLLSFAVSVSTFAFLIYVTVNADDQLVGYRLGSESLGFYSMAYGLAMWSVRDVLGGLSAVVYPVFARFQDDLPRLRVAYLEVVQLSVAFAFPVLVMIVVVAPRFIPLLMGSRWVSMVLLVQIFAVVGLRESVLMLNGHVYRAVGRPEVHTLLALVSMVCYVVGFVVGLSFGVVGVALFYAVVSFALFPVSLWVLCDVLDLLFLRWLLVVFPVLLSVCAAGFLGWVFLSNGSGLFVFLLLFLLVYALFLFVFARSVLVGFWGVFVSLCSLVGCGSE